MSRLIDAANAALNAVAEADVAERTPMQARLYDALLALFTLAKEQDAEIADLRSAVARMQAPVPIAPDAPY